jgi:hypothetical protein
MARDPANRAAGVALKFFVRALGRTHSHPVLMSGAVWHSGFSL